MYAAPSCAGQVGVLAEGVAIWRPSAARWRGRPAGAARRAGRRPVYSCRAMSANALDERRRRRSRRGRVVSGHCENGPAVEGRARVVGERVARVGRERDRDAEAGGRRRAPAAGCASAAISGRSVHAPSRLKWVIRLPSTNSRAEGVPNAGFAASRSPIPMMVWKNSPAFSSRVIAFSSECHAFVDGQASVQPWARRGVVGR